jgi:threonine aldolase
MKWQINLYDTSINPTPEMRAAMQYCEVGDDAYGEDPSVNLLEEEAAKLVGKESAVFVSSGTMGNLIGLMVQTNHGEEVILEAESHIYHYETGGLIAIAGLIPKLIKGQRGVLLPESVEKVLHQSKMHHPCTKLLSIENTHNRAGGIITSPEIMKQLHKLCEKNEMKIHLDGARIFNAAVALNVPVTDFTEQVDTLMFCLSKGLGAPVGSILAGDQKTIEEARRIRKILGGGMRRVGFLASAGLIALRTGISRLERDHRLTKVLARALMEIEGIRIDYKQVQTNMVLIDSSVLKITAEDLKNELKNRGIKVLAMPPYSIRMVVHKDIRDSQIPIIVDAINEVIQKIKG